MVVNRRLYLFITRLLIMNFKRTLVLLTSLLALGASVAQTAPSPSDFLLKKSMKKHRMNIGACHFVINDPFSGRASDGSGGATGPYAGYKAAIAQKKGAALSMQFECGDGYDVKACDGFQGEIYASGGTIMDADPPIPDSDKIQDFKFRSINGVGRIVVYNQIQDATGPGDQDGRSLSFCLSSPKGATLVGLATVKKSKNDKLDLTNEAIRIVKGIEFNDSSK